MAIALTEPTNQEASLICIKAVITVGDDDLTTTYSYKGQVVGLIVAYTILAKPDADWDLQITDEQSTDLTNGHGEALTGAASDYNSKAVQQFCATDMDFTPVDGKITFGEDGMATPSCTATVYLFIEPANPQRESIQ